MVYHPNVSKSFYIFSSVCYRPGVNPYLFFSQQAFRTIFPALQKIEISDICHFLSWTISILLIVI